MIDGRLDAVMKTGLRRAEIDLPENEIDDANLDQSAREAVEEELEAARERQLELRKHPVRRVTSSPPSRQNQ